MHQNQSSTAGTFYYAVIGGDNSGVTILRQVHSYFILSCPTPFLSFPFPLLSLSSPIPFPLQSVPSWWKKTTIMAHRLQMQNWEGCDGDCPCPRPYWSTHQLRPQPRACSASLLDLALWAYPAVFSLSQPQRALLPRHVHWTRRLRGHGLQRLAVSLIFHSAGLQYDKDWPAVL